MKNLLVIALFFLCSQGIAAQSALCPTVGPNLIVNGDFEQGYYAFTSDFGRGRNNATLGGCGTQGWILVCQVNLHLSPACQIYPFNLSGQYGSPNSPTSSDPNDPSNTSVVTSATCDPLPDHTTGSGFFLSIDPDAVAGRAYWKQTVTVCPQTNYVFSVWVRNVSPGCGLPAPTFHFEVGGVPINAPVSYPDCEWVNTAASWNSGNLSGPVQIQLVNDLPGCDANDVAIDDVFFGICNGAFLTCDPRIDFCGDSLGGSLTLSGGSEGFVNPQFQWQRYNPLLPGWVDIPGATDPVYVIPNVTTAEAGSYRFISAPGGIPIAQSCASAASPVVQIVSHPVYNHSIVENICDGALYSGYSSAGIYLDTFQSVFGCDSIRRLDLRVNPHYETDRSITLCPGGSYNFNGTVLSASGVYQDTLQTIFGCDSIFYLELEVPPSQFLGNDTVVCTASSFKIVSPEEQTTWFDNSSGKEKTVTQTGDYWARFTDTNGCSVLDSIRVQFDVEAYVPNAFSPDDDGENDLFLPNFSWPTFDRYECRVFDRWGNEVFFSADPAQGWDGRARGKDCAAGVYIYLIEIETRVCKKVTLKGDVSLIKN